ncbi:MAG: hypothetical protein WA655_11935 [Candidatus Korobacteraceae bacterium]
MSNLKRLPKNWFTEAEAAAALGITLNRLYRLLDQHIFNEGRQRPKNIEFTSSDLLLLGYWNNQEPPQMQVLQMPKPG